MNTFDVTSDCVALPKFSLGCIISTRGVFEYIDNGCIHPRQYLKRHLLGDWGDLCSDDKAANDEALVFGDRIFSSYSTGILDEPKLWVITEHDRSSTTLLFPHEY